MSGYAFEVVGIEPEPYAASPQLTARLRIRAPEGVTVHAIALRCQLRIDPQRRGYQPVEADRLLALFGARDRWSQTLRPFVWMHASTTVPGFTGQTETELPLACSYDFDVVGSRFLHALGEGNVPLSLLFSGTVFTRGESGFAVQHVPWDCDASYELPVAVWHQLIQLHYPGTGWLRLDRGLLDELAQYRARHGLTSWEETIRRLLDENRSTVSP